MSDIKRGSVLLDAHTVINGERQDVYGSPEDSFALIAKYWNVYLDPKLVDSEYDSGGITAQDVAMMMVLFKIAREANQHKRDSVTDACGYLGIYEDMESAKDGAK
jgi:hypothetical protein